MYLDNKGYYAEKEGEKAAIHSQNSKTMFYMYSTLSHHCSSQDKFYCGLYTVHNIVIKVPFKDIYSRPYNLFSSDAKQT